MNYFACHCSQLNEYKNNWHCSLTMQIFTTQIFKSRLFSKHTTRLISYCWSAFWYAHVNCLTNILEVECSWFRLLEESVVALLDICVFRLHSLLLHSRLLVHSLSFHTHVFCFVFVAFSYRLNVKRCYTVSIIVTSFLFFFFIISIIITIKNNIKYSNKLYFWDQSALLV